MAETFTLLMFSGTFDLVNEIRGKKNKLKLNICIFRICKLNSLNLGYNKTLLRRSVSAEYFQYDMHACFYSKYTKQRELNSHSSIID